MTDVKENRDRQIDEINEDLEYLKEKNENLEKEIEEKNKINNEINNLNLEINKEKVICNEKDKQINTLNNNINDLNNLINNINEEKSKINEENKKLREEIKKLKDDNDTNRINIQKQEKENNILKADKSQMIMRLSTLNDEKLKLRQSLNIFETKEEEINKEINKLKNDLKQKENIINNKNKENKELFSEKEKLSDEIILLKNEMTDKENKLNNKEERIKELKEEIEEKNSQVENIIKNINDYELQLKGLKDEKQELLLNNKKYINEIKEEKNKYNNLKKDYENLKKENQKLQEIKMSQYKDEDINQKLIVEIDDEEMQRQEDIDKLKNNIEELTNNINQKNQEIEKYKTSYFEMRKKYDKISLELKNNNNAINSTTTNDKSEKTLNEKDTEMSSVENEYNILKNKISQLKEENAELNTKLNNINIQYIKQEKDLKNKEIELKNMKEVSQAMIEKQKKQLEQEENIDPSNSTIISSKIYKKLTWYLVYKYNTNNKNDMKKPDENNYNSYHWVNGNIIRRDKLSKFNPFEEDEKKIRELQEYIFDLQKKLERKEESISRLDYKNRKLNEQIQNKTASTKGFGLSRISDTDKNKLKNNFANSMASNEMISDIDKYKNILEQLNDSNKRETKLHNEIIQLKTELKKKEEFVSGIPQDLKNIDKSVDSGFLDEDLKENPNGGMINFIKESNNINNKKDLLVSTKTVNDNSNIIANNENDTFNYKEAEKKADEFLKEGAGDESDYNEIKQIQKQMKFIKDQLKESLLKYEQLSEQVQELLKNIKCDLKIKPQISQICQILGYSPQTTSRILNNKKGGILGLIKGK